MNINYIHFTGDEFYYRDESRYNIILKWDAEKILVAFSILVDDRYGALIYCLNNTYEISYFLEISKRDGLSVYNTDTILETLECLPTRDSVAKSMHLGVKILNKDQKCEILNNLVATSLLTSFCFPGEIVTTGHRFERYADSGFANRYMFSENIFNSLGLIRCINDRSSVNPQEGCVSKYIISLDKFLSDFEKENSKHVNYEYLREGYLNMINGKTLLALTLIESSEDYRKESFPIETDIYTID